MTVKLIETTYSGPRMAFCRDCDWTERSDGAVSPTHVTRAARLHAQTKAHRVNVGTMETLQLVPCRYSKGKWHVDARKADKARRERAANHV